MSKESSNTFRQQTVAALNACANYLKDNSEELAKRFSDDSHGCKGWSIEFRAGDDGFFPYVEIHESAQTVSILAAYDSADVENGGCSTEEEDA